METISKAVNVVSETVTNTIWGGTKTDNDPSNPNFDNKIPTSSSTTSTSGTAQHKNVGESTFDKPASGLDSNNSSRDNTTADITGVKNEKTDIGAGFGGNDRFPSIMGQDEVIQDQGATALRNDKDQPPIAGLENLSLNQGPRNEKLEMEQGQNGYPFKDTDPANIPLPSTITGAETGNVPTMHTMIDSSGGSDRDLEGKKSDKGHRRVDSGHHELFAHQNFGRERHEDGIKRTEEGGTYAQDRGATHTEGAPSERFGNTTNDDGISRTEDGGRKKIEPSGEVPTANFDKTHPAGIRIGTVQGGSKAEKEHEFTPITTAVGPQREGLSSSNEPKSQGNPDATSTAIHPMGKGFTHGSGGPIEPSVGAIAGSGAQTTSKQQGADRPTEVPSHVQQKDESHEGAGTKYERSTGLPAEGGDFDASRPGAGKEADRLLEESGVHRDVPGGRAGTQLNEGHKFSHLLPHTSKHEAEAAAAGEEKKKGLAEKIKEKMHIGLSRNGEKH